MDSGLLIIGGLLAVIFGGGGAEFVRQMTAHQPPGGNALSWLCLAFVVLGSLCFLVGVHKEWTRAARRRAARGGR